MKKSIIALSLLGLVITGCKKEPYIVKSTLKVENAFEVKNDNAKLVTLNAGDYPTDLNINSARVKATVRTESKKNVTFRFKLPKGMKLPTNGTLELTPAQSGQPFQTSVSIKTIVETGPTKRSVENCQITYQDYDCYVGGNPPRSICGPVTRTRWGRRDVDYFDRSYHREILAKLFPADSKITVLANIDGSRTDSERVYTREGYCF